MQNEHIHKKLLIISWLFQISAAIILAIAGWFKISGASESIFVFTSLGMEPNGRIIIGIIECLSALMLLTRGLPHLGASLGFALMIGAVFAHISVLGLEVQDDNGTLVLMLLVVLISTIAVMFIHRKRLPLIGDLL